jgi:hypothetical protein
LYKLHCDAGIFGKISCTCGQRQVRTKKIEELIRIRIIICMRLPPLIIEKNIKKIQFTTKRCMSLFVAHFSNRLSNVLYVAIHIYTVWTKSLRLFFFKSKTCEEDTYFFLFKISSTGIYPGFCAVYSF